MTPTISAPERDALYEQIFARLSGIDGVWLAAEAGDFGDADRLAREFADELRLLVEDIGWGDRHGDGSLELTTPAHILRRVLTRLQSRVEGQQAQEEEERAEGLRREERNQTLMAACQRVLAELGDCP